MRWVQGSMNDTSEPLVRFSKPVGRYEKQWDQGIVQRYYNTVKYKYLPKIQIYTKNIQSGVFNVLDFL